MRRDRDRVEENETMLRVLRRFDLTGLGLQGS
jgi:hypothetical protein